MCFLKMPTHYCSMSKYTIFRNIRILHYRDAFTKPAVISYMNPFYRIKNVTTLKI